MTDTVTFHTRGGKTREVLVAKCPVCKGKFYPRRRSAVYCSNACKQRMYRVREKLRKAKHAEKVRQLELRGLL